MTVEQFFHEYANTILDERSRIINIDGMRPMSLNAIYFRLKDLEDKMRPFRIERDKILIALENSKLK